MIDFLTVYGNNYPFNKMLTYSVDVQLSGHNTIENVIQKKNSERVER